MAEYVNVFPNGDFKRWMILNYFIYRRVNTKCTNLLDVDGIKLCHSYGKLSTNSKQSNTAHFLEFSLLHMLHNGFQVNQTRQQKFSNTGCNESTILILN